MRGMKNMKKLYSRIVFGPDDDSISGNPTGNGELEVEVDETYDLQADMDDLFDETAPIKEPEEPEEPSGVDVETDVKSEETEITEEEPEPEVEVEVEPEPEPEPDDSITELNALRAANAQLLEKINELSGQPVTPKVNDPVQVAPVQDPIPQPATPGSVDLKEVFKDTDLTEVMNTKDSFLGFMQQIVDGAVGAAVQNTMEQFNDQAPKIVNETVNNHTQMQQVREEFFNDNPALLPVSKYVANVANGISEKNPDWTIRQVLDQAAIDTKVQLNIQEMVKKPSESGRSKPALPGAGGGPRTKPRPSNSLADEIEDLFSDI